MKDHMAQTVSRCFCLFVSWKSLALKVARAAVAAFITSQVDRCNSFWSALLISSWIACILSSMLSLCNRRKCDHVTLLLCDVLHWLPVPLRVEFKVCLMVYKSRHGASLGYLRDYWTEKHFNASWLRLRSTYEYIWELGLVTVPIQMLAQDAWPALRAANSIDSFKTGLKTHTLLLVDCKVPFCGMAVLR